MGKNTGDWATYKNNYYSNKAPGIALLGIPCYYLIYHVETMIGIDPTDDVHALINAYLLNILLTVLPISLSVLFFFRIALNLGHQNYYFALLATSALYWGTLIFPYSSQLWGHVTAAAFVIISLYFFINDLDAHSHKNKKKSNLDDGPINEKPVPSVSHLIICGFFAGLAVLTEYSCIIVAFMFAIGILRTNHRIQILSYLAGGTIPIILFALYHKSCFGSYFTLANVYNNPYFLNDGYIGSLFGSFSTEALWGITFSSYRGMFIYMPVLILFIPALLERKQFKYDLVFLMCVANIFCFILMNVTFNGWHGGACFGPRYLIPIMPFIIILILATFYNRPYRFFTLLLLLPSIFNMFLGTVISPQVPKNAINPLPRYYDGFKLTIRGYNNLLHPWTFPIRLQEKITPEIKKYSAFNLGEMIGLKSSSSLLPWVIFLLGAGLLTKVSIDLLNARKNENSVEID